jgi:hypothetical protein
VKNTTENVDSFRVIIKSRRKYNTASVEKISQKKKQHLTQCEFVNGNLFFEKLALCLPFSPLLQSHASAWAVWRLSARNVDGAGIGCAT